MQDTAEGEPLDAVEVLPVEWAWADGVAHVEVIGGTVRFVLYVVDVRGGEAGGQEAGSGASRDRDHQKRVSLKVVLPIEGVLGGLQKTLAALVRPVRLMRVASGRAVH